MDENDGLIAIEPGMGDQLGNEVITGTKRDNVSGREGKPFPYNYNTEGVTNGWVAENLTERVAYLYRLSMVHI